MLRCCKHRQIDHIFHKLLDSIEQCLTWCFKFMQGIWDRIQTVNSKCSISSAGSELQSEEEGGGGRRRCEWKEHSPQMTRKTDKKHTSEIWEWTEGWWMDRREAGGTDQWHVSKCHQSDTIKLLILWAINAPVFNLGLLVQSFVCSLRSDYCQSLRQLPHTFTARPSVLINLDSSYFQFTFDAAIGRSN